MQRTRLSALHAFDEAFDDREQRLGVRSGFELVVGHRQRCTNDDERRAQRRALGRLIDRQSTDGLERYGDRRPDALQVVEWRLADLGVTFVESRCGR